MSGTWWGEFRVEEGVTRYWQVGPLRLWATRQPEEWQLATESTADNLANEVAAAVEPPTQPGPDARTARFGFRSSPKAIRLAPATADRPVVVKAASPFFIPAGEELSLFVSTALWLQVRVDGSTDLLYETPFHRPSDTWFGSSTREGELCYAAKIAIRHRLESVPRRPHRAISVVRIRNRAATQLELERLKLPSPVLSLYGCEDGSIWTESVTLERREEGENAMVTLGRGAPRAADNARKIAGPRQHVEPGILSRTFGGLFGRTGARNHERVAE
ncbi:hypothetical protein K8I85_16805 [bacterium]|nr:hypothetical protein [bacterium]